MSIYRDDTIEWIKACADVLAENKDYLTELDAAIGDADHGANMDRGFRAVIGKMPELVDKDIGTIFKTVGMTLLSTVGGAGGPLYGTFYLQAGMKSAGKMELNLEDWTLALEAAVDGVVMRGKAELEDKTMVDALTPAVNSLKSAINDSTPFSEALKNSAEAAKEGMVATIPLVAKKGRASHLGERSAGHQDPGATSSYLILQAAAVGGLAVLMWADRIGIVALGLIGLAVLAGYNYFASLFYSSDAGTDHRRGLSSGIHEATLLLGLGAGAIIGGIAGELWGLRAPYALAAGVIGLLILPQIAIFLQRVRPLRRPDDSLGEY